MVEGHHEERVVRGEQVDEEALDGRASVHEALAEHAVADVEQEADADRHTLAGELRNRLRRAVLEDLEAVARQVGHQPAVGVAHGGRDRRHLHARAQRAGLADDRRTLRAEHNGARQRDAHERARETMHANSVQ